MMPTASLREIYEVLFDNVTQDYRHKYERMTDIELKTLAPLVWVLRKLYEYIPEEEKK